MWGTEEARRYTELKLRFIPTHVGNGELPPWGVTPDSVHPHACGERAVESDSVGLTVGSSPRMWGTDRQYLQSPTALRFIPTHVGNGGLKSYQQGRGSVHPHACGERLIAQCWLWITIGSSPRMWGTVINWQQWQCHIRYIPTHVGNGSLDSERSYSTSVHPHACGERITKQNTGYSKTGSSPRMWGTGPNHQQRRQKGRFIPTHVGNGPDNALQDRLNAVHPHACGERRYRRF